MRNFRFITIYTFALLLVGVSCKTTKKNLSNRTPKVKDQIAQPEIKIIPSYVPEEAPYRPSNEKKHDLLSTKLEVSFDFENQYLIGTALLELKPYFYAQKELVLDAKGFDIESVKMIESNGERDLNYKYEDTLKLIINLGREFVNDEIYKVEIKYVAKPNELPDPGGSRAITKDLGLYFINPKGEEKDKPIQIWTQGETEASSCWFPTIDSPNEKTTQEIYITIDNKYKTLSNGLLLSSTDNGDGTRTDYWKQEKPHAPYLFMMAIGEFAVVKDKWKDKEVSYYVEPEFEPHAKAVFGNTPEMLSFFSEKLGFEFPWDKYAQIVVRDFVSGAMENTSASVFMEQLQITSRETLDKNWDYIIAHELFHHWFGDLVTCESWSNLALNESFANYAEYLWLEHKYGRDMADAHRMEEMSQYLRSPKQYPIIRYHYHHRMEMFDAHSYNKGGLVLHMLRKLVGDDAFFTSLKHYLHKNQYTDVEIHELRIAFEDVTGLDLQWFFEQWFMKPGHLDLSVNHKYQDGELLINTIQKQDSAYTPIYKLPMQIEVWVNGKKEVHELEISKYKQAFQFPCTEKPDLVLFDAEQQLLGFVDHNKEFSEWVYQYEHGACFQSRWDALDTLSDQLFTLKALEKVIQSDSENKGVFQAKYDEIKGSEQEIVTLLIKAIKDPFEDIRKKAIESLTIYYSSDSVLKKDEIVALMVSRAERDEISKVRASAYDFLSGAEEKISQTELLPLYRKGVKDSSYSVNAAALQGYIIADAPDAQKVIETFKSSDKIDIINGVASYYIKTEDTTQFDWMLHRYLDAKPIQKMHFSEYFAEYLKVVNASSREQGLKLFEKYATEDEDIYVRFSGYKGLWMLDGLAGVRDRRLKIVKQEDNLTLQQVYERKEKQIKGDKPGK